MIKVRTWEDGRTHYLAPATIRRVSDTSPIDQRLGQNAKVVTDDGTLIVRQKPAEIVEAMRGVPAEVQAAAQSLRSYLEAPHVDTRPADTDVRKLVDYVLGGTA